MLVYAANLRLCATPGIDKLLDIVAVWLHRKGAGTVSPQVLAKTNSLRLSDGSYLQSWTEWAAYPRLYALRLTHGDREVPGREWSTELGVEDPGDGSDLRATILLETSEVSARVLSPVLITRPRLVESILLECAPVSDTPGLTVRALTLESARAFEYVVTDERRAHPLVVISPTGSGDFLLSAERLRSLVAGLAEVIQIRSDVDTFALADSLGREHVSWLGAVRILFPPRMRGGDRFIPRVSLMPDAIAEILAEGRSVEAEILSILAHRMNLATSRGHIRPERVRELSLRREIARRRREAEEAGSTAELLPLYEEADRENKEKIRQLEEYGRTLDDVVDGLEDEKRSLSSQNEALKAALSRTASPAVSGIPVRTRDALMAVLRGTPSLEDSLHVIAHLFPDRLVVLDSAWKSARAASRFRHVDKALGLLQTLVTSYWQALNDGQGDNEGRKLFGKAYAANESETVMGNKRARALRTFVHEGQPIEMWKHLRIGNKPSVAETLRIHFEWKDGKLVVGHCGEHLDHG
jgi:hypothetical protein